MLDGFAPARPKVDVAAWDKGKKVLMTTILRAQVQQHEDLRNAVRDYADD